jgi:hypothetical protein
MDRIEEFGTRTARAALLLLEAELVGQSLVIVYSAIDALAWSRRISGDVKRADFFDWVTRYMVPDAELGCSAKDLYGARCGLVHSGTADSTMGQQGEATPLWYATDDAGVPALQAFVATRDATAKVVCVRRLISIFEHATSAFAKDISGDQARVREVEERIKPWLAFVSPRDLIGGRPL